MINNYSFLQQYKNSCTLLPADDTTLVELIKEKTDGLMTAIKLNFSVLTDPINEKEGKKRIKEIKERFKV